MTKHLSILILFSSKTDTLRIKPRTNSSGNENLLGGNGGEEGGIKIFNMMAVGYNKKYALIDKGNIMISTRCDISTKMWIANKDLCFLM